MERVSENLLGVGMTNSQKCQIKLSEQRVRLNDLAGKESEELTEAEVKEIEELQENHSKTEVLYRAAVIAEGESEARASDAMGGGDAEARERRELIGKTTITEYLKAVKTNRSIEGRARETNEALEVPITCEGGGSVIPWEILETRQRQAPGIEKRVFTDTGDIDGSVVQMPILSRVLGKGIMDALGVRLDQVPSGRSEWAVLTGGASPVMVAEGVSAAAPVEAVLSSVTLRPKKIFGSYDLTWELEAQIPFAEEALRRDLGEAIRAAMNKLILTGDNATNSHEPDGFLNVLDPEDPAPTSESDFANYSGTPSRLVDGLHADGEGAVSGVIGVASYAHAGSVFSTGSGESGIEAMIRRAATIQASSFVPPVVSTLQTGNIFHAGQEPQGDSVGAIWSGISVTRDIFGSQSSIGPRISWLVLWDFKAALRPKSYKRISYKVS